jgi:hypothetical protein
MLINSPFTLIFVDFELFWGSLGITGLKKRQLFQSELIPLLDEAAARQKKNQN